MATIDDVLREVNINEGHTQAELATRIFGRARAYPQRVSAACLELVAAGVIERKGKGTPFNPYTFWLPRAGPTNRN